MQGHELIGSAVATTITTVRAVDPDQLDRPTPCDDFTVRALLDHLGRTVPYLIALAGGNPSANGSEATGADLESKLAQLTAVWSDPRAWEGQTDVGGQEMPAALAGGMTFAEMVLHSWDLARATGQSTDFDPDVLAFTHSKVVTTSPLGRKMGAYGQEVEVPPTASVLDRTLGLAGRDPAWKN